MPSDSSPRSRELEGPVGSDELAEGLMLVRASTLKMIRLQLAMERQDRRVALEAVDDLVALDRRLEDYLADVPGAGDRLMFRDALETERQMLNHEKLTLAAEIVRREPDTVPAEMPAEPEDAWETFDFVADGGRRPRRAILWFAILLGVLAAAAIAAWVVIEPNAMEELARNIGGVS